MAAPKIMTMLHWATRRHVEIYHQDGECTIYASDCSVLGEIEVAHEKALEISDKLTQVARLEAHGSKEARLAAYSVRDEILAAGFEAQAIGDVPAIKARAQSQLQIHTAGELHDAPEIGRVTFTYNLSDLLDDPAHKPGAELIERDGTDVDVQDFVFQSAGALELFEDIVDTVARQLQRKPITVLFLCRGGKHRSVAFGEALAYHFDVTATHHHKHLPRVVSGETAAEQVWECVDEVGRTGERVRITEVLMPTSDEESTVLFVVSRAAKGYEAELGSDGSMETAEFRQRYKLVK